jgi:hypothetical protein
LPSIEGKPFLLLGEIMKKLFRSALVFTVSATAFGQYTVQMLPTPTGVGYIEDAGGGQIVGHTHAGPALWNAPEYKFVSLNSPKYTFEEVWGVGGGKQVGYGVMDAAHALMWSGSAGSVVDLHNDIFLGTIAYGTDGKSQVGSGAVSQNAGHAALWRGTAASIVDLHPKGFELSAATGVWGEIQVGSAVNGPGGQRGAVMWRGTSESMQFLPIPKGHAPGDALAVSGEQIVGGTSVSGNGHAALWSTDGLSVTDLTPKGWGAIAVDTNGSQQVGQAGFGDGPRAVVWTGTAESMVDLHALLPKVFVESHAFGIDDNGVIAGWGVQPGVGNVPLIWTPVPEPAGLATAGLGFALLFSRRRRQ